MMENRNIVKEIRNFVEEECKKPSSKYGYEPFLNHFSPVVENALELANKLEEKGIKLDKEVIEISAWLHDIGSIIYGRENHHKTGAKIAEEKLTELNYPKNKIILVKESILNHRGSKEDENTRESIESQIIAEADALDSFKRVSGLFKGAFVFENKTQEEARISVLNKLKNKWNQLQFEESKQLIKPKYEAALLLLGDK